MWVKLCVGQMKHAEMAIATFHAFCNLAYNYHPSLPSKLSISMQLMGKLQQGIYVERILQIRTSTWMHLLSVTRH